MMKINASDALHADAGNVVPSAYESYLKALGYLSGMTNPVIPISRFPC